MAATMKDIAKETRLVSQWRAGEATNKKLIDNAVRKLQFVPNEFPSARRGFCSIRMGL